MKFAVIKTGGKQYLVCENDEIYVDQLKEKTGQEMELQTLAAWDLEKEKVELGTPILKSKVKAKLIENLKGDKIRVSRFKAKVRYRRVKGFRPYLSKIKIVKI
jgi:large subunit ribosomal protein L21